MADQFEFHIRDNKPQVREGVTYYFFGKISFLKKGKEYDVDKIMKRFTPRIGDMSLEHINGGIIYSGVTLMFDKDFLVSDEVLWEETIKYRKQCRREQLEREHKELMKKTDEALVEIERKYKEQMAEIISKYKKSCDDHKKSDNHTKSDDDHKKLDARKKLDVDHTKSDIDYNKLNVDCKKLDDDRLVVSGVENSMCVCGGFYTGEEINESRDIVEKKYPNLLGHYFNSYGGLNVNWAVSTIMNDIDRANFFEQVKNKKFNVIVGVKPYYVQLNKYRFKKYEYRWTCNHE
jgi:hypothetical protein